MDPLFRLSRWPRCRTYEVSSTQCCVSSVASCRQHRSWLCSALLLVSKRRSYIRVSCRFMINHSCSKSALNTFVCCIVNAQDAPQRKPPQPKCRNTGLGRHVNPSATNDMGFNKHSHSDACEDVSSKVYSRFHIAKSSDRAGNRIGYHLQHATSCNAPFLSCPTLIVLTLPMKSLRSSFSHVTSGVTEEA